MSEIASSRLGASQVIFPLTLDSLGDGQEDAGDECLAVVGLLEDDDLLSKSGAIGRGNVSGSAGMMVVMVGNRVATQVGEEL